MIDTLLTVPAAMAAYLNGPDGLPWQQRLGSWGPGALFITSDPRERRLGSGGGTVHLLHAACKAAGQSLDTWLAAAPKLILHAGGESRRLPAYAAVGKAFIPIPLLPGLPHQRFDQVLCDFQLPTYRQVLAETAPCPVAMVTSGDVWLDFDPLCLPPVQADIVGIGMRVDPDVARHFGVFFVSRRGRARAAAERPIAFFLQKPEPRAINQQLADYEFFVDTGMWLLSARAVRFLFHRCGWDDDRQRFATTEGHPDYLDLYTEVGAALGEQTPPPPALAAAGFGELTRSVIPLDEARFHHLGSTAQIFTFLDQVQRHGVRHHRRFLIGASADALDASSGSPVWVESCHTERPLFAAGHNLINGLPDGHAIRQLPRDLCLDIVPLGDRGYVFRPYHLNDTLRGAPDDPAATICGQPATAWLAARGLAATAKDVFELPLYPQLDPPQLTQELLDWFVAVSPDPALTAAYAGWPRHAARDLVDGANLHRLMHRRHEALAAHLDTQFEHIRREGDGPFLAQDFHALGDFVATHRPALASQLLSDGEALAALIPDPVHRARLQLFLSALAPDAAVGEAITERGFALLRDAIATSHDIRLVAPALRLKRDQVVWARSPVRLDLGGGWTDTPPYCLEFGGAVVNLAVMLNGQPPIQVIARVLEQPELRVRSIDQGNEETIATFDELDTFRDPRATFSLPKAALALAGFHPRFYPGTPYPDLRSQLADFGGGLELSLLCAVPKGSGLGTSSILAATLLGALNRAGGLDLDQVDLYHRVLAMEQLMTTGGGWQDQAGALFRGLKLIETAPGPEQDPIVRYLPEHLFGPEHANHRLLLYYTGITRLAKAILQQIVRHMFLGEGRTLATLDLIRRNAARLNHALLTGDSDDLVRAIARSWQLNKRLDPDTTNPAIERILATCGDDLVAAKLLGAGGGGYMLICAADAAAGERIRRRLEANPPNPLARFVEFEVARDGLQVTVS